MYSAVMFALLIVAALLVLYGIRGKRTVFIAGGIVVAAFTVALFGLMGFYGEMLWFQSLGYGRRFFQVIFIRIAGVLIGGLFGFAVLFAMTRSLPPEKRSTKWWASGIGAFLGAQWGYVNWQVILVFLYRVSTDVTDPILNVNTGFYMFSLPFFDALYELLMPLAMVSLLVGVFALFIRVTEEGIDLDRSRFTETMPESRVFPLYLATALLFLVLAYGYFLERYHLLLSVGGTVHGAGWTDDNIRLPVLWLIILIFIGLSAVLLVPAVRGAIRRVGARFGLPAPFSPLLPIGVSAVVGFLVVAIFLNQLPGMFQWLRVEPNEITFEKEYIQHNIRFTRRGFNLHEIKEQEYPAKERFTEAMVDENKDLFNNIRLWDWRALDSVYKQFQEIRLYYEFHDVDIDRYQIDDKYRQVMVSARELLLDNLPAKSRTFVNERFKYTHGFGLTLTNVNEFTPEGLPQLLIKDLPPKSVHPELEVTQPRIYYGELTDEYVVVNTDEMEFDYPSGDKNKYVRYQGKGGVQIKNIWRKFLYGWRFGGTRFFLSGYPNNESRIMFHREIGERVKRLAPFLRFDGDPYIVLSKGKLYWIIDAYTTSNHYPYSEPFFEDRRVGYTPGKRRNPQFFSPDQTGFSGANYVRNSVKAVVDAYNGSVDFYVFDKEDPVINVWRKAFPDLFTPREQMPKDLEAHIRYPHDILLAQGLVFAKYHMTDPAVFYNQEDLWVRATEKYYGAVQPVRPYYIMWEPPHSENLEFVLILPFTPKNRQVLIGWIAGMCDPGNYGQLIAYKFPKERRVLGPQQVETKIDQDRHLSGQLTLWDQRGSNVIRGNVLAIPIEETIIYVEPIYLKAETAAYPELRLVAVMHNDRLSYAESFDKAIRGLFREGPPAEAEQPPPETPTAPAPSPVRDTEHDELIRRANRAFTDYLESTGQKEFEKSAEALKRLQQALEELSRRTGPAAATEETGAPAEGSPQPETPASPETPTGG